MVSDLKPGLEELPLDLGFVNGFLSIKFFVLCMYLGSGILVC